MQKMKTLMDFIFKIRGVTLSYEIYYLIDLLFRTITKLLRINTHLGDFLFRDIVVISKEKENSLFYIKARSDMLYHITPTYEAITWRRIKSIIEPGDICVDVGAHIGTYTIPIARMVGSNGFVLAIEPSPVKDILSINVKINGLQDRVTIIDKAVHSKRELFDLYYNPSRTGWSFLVKDQLERSTTLCKIKVEALPLDEILKESGIANRRIKLLKIDVEGNEVEVLRGAQRTLENTDYVIFEASKETINECVRILNSLGFKVSLLEKYGNVANYIAKKER